MKNKTIVAALLLFAFGGMAIESKADAQLLRRRCCEPLLRFRPLLKSKCSSCDVYNVVQPGPVCATVNCDWVNCEVTYNDDNDRWEVTKRCLCKEKCYCPIPSDPPTGIRTMRTESCRMDPNVEDGNSFRLVVEKLYTFQQDHSLVFEISSNPDQAGDFDPVQIYQFGVHKWTINASYVSNDETQKKAVKKAKVSGTPTHRVRFTYFDGTDTVTVEREIVESTGSQTVNFMYGRWNVDVELE